MIENFKNSLQTGFIDTSFNSDILYQPELLVNRKKPLIKVSTAIENELRSCKSFFISVAFVTTGGIATLFKAFEDLEKRGVKGKIIVSQYLNFTQPEALKKLAKFKNIELKISTNGNSHSKGYIFEKGNYYNLIIGSSNLTGDALCSNKEWNLKVSSLHSGAIVQKVLQEFEIDFNQGELVTSEFIEKYSQIYDANRISIFQNEKLLSNEDYNEIVPNEMQKDALANLSLFRNHEKHKALIISATGTGKTYLSAFDVKAFGAKKMLFVVHRKNIALKSMESFKKIFENKKTMGLYSGDKKELNCDFIFSTVQTLSKEENLTQFTRDHFDYIIIDESHRAGADSYLRVIEYFQPLFLLGMTATPERTDGNDIFSLYDHNIAYEIRLQKAMEEDMLSPFHYYGVSDLIIEGEEQEDFKEFNYLVTDEKVNKILNSANFYGTDNGIIRGLVFCSRNEEAKALSDKFNEKGYKTVALSGTNSEEERIDAIEKLESSDLENKLDYIFSVDIFNEGVDIPSVNQILMIRPTDSAIIFIQQLGRGLRKTIGKSYLTIIDFIANYKNNYLIPIALYGDTSYNKDSLRKLISEGSRSIYGSSTINFDEISKEKIYQSIDSANMQLLSDLKKDYQLLKFKLGRIPMMMDFVDHGSRDPFLYIEYSRSYYNFVSTTTKDVEVNLTPLSIKLLELFSKEINNTKRVEESIILKNLIEKGTYSLNELSSFIENKYGYKISEDTISSCIKNLNFEFIREKKDGQLLSAKNIYEIDVVSYENKKFILSENFKLLLKQPDFKNYLLDSINYSIFIFNHNFDINKWNNGFILYNKYSRKDVFRILNFDENPVAQNVGGYLVSPDNKYCPIFVNYHKEEDISDSTKYEDSFINNKEFEWMSKSKRKLSSPDVQSIMGKNGEIRLPLFIKKSNAEGSDFYYMGDVNPKKANPTFMKDDNGNDVSVVKILFDLDHPVSDEIYNYLQENIV